MLSYEKAVSSILVLVALIGVVVFLRKKGVIDGDSGPQFAKLVTQFTLPALIFFSLASTTFVWDQAILALVMLAAEIVCLGLAWFIGRSLKLAPPQMGAFVLVCGFGSSSLLGYAFISELFPANAAAIVEAVIISELGVGPALFTIGVMIAIYYGSQSVSPAARFKAAMAFFRSPIFFSVVAGLAWSTLKLPIDIPVVSTLFEGLKVVGSANTLMVALTVGVMLHFQNLKEVALLAAIVIVLKLVLKPILVWLPTLAMSFTATQVHILVLEGAMPSAMLTVVLSATYGCDAKLASKLVFATTVVSCASILVVYGLLG